MRTVVWICILALSGISWGQSVSPRQLAPRSFNWKPWLRGSDMAVLEGNPSQPGPFTIRIRARAGTKIAPHWNAADVNITVISGAFALGLGSTFDNTANRPMPTGSFVTVPKKMPYFLLFKSECTIQVHGEGPFVMNSVEPGSETGDRH